MARRIQEGDGLAVNLHGVGTDGLGDAAGFTGGNVGFADIVQKGGFAVVDMAHHHHNGCSGDEIFRAVLMVVNEALLHGDDDFLLHLAAQLHCHQCCGVIIDDVGDGDEGAHLHQGLDHFGGGLLHSRGKLTHCDLVRNFHFELLLSGNFKVEACHLVTLFLTALCRGGLGVGALLGFALDLLLVAAPHVGAVGLVAAEILILFVVFVDIHGRTAARIHNTLLRHLTRRERLVGLGLLRRLILHLGSGCLLCTRRVLRLFAILPGLCLSFRLGSLALLILGRLAVCLVGFLFFRLGSRSSGGRNLKDLFKAGHLIVLGHVFKNDVQLLVGKNLHVVFGRSKILGHNRSNVLVRHAEIFRNFS